MFTGKSSATHQSVEDLAIMHSMPNMRVLVAAGGTPAGEDGGFLLPVDFDNLIWTLRRDYTARADLVTVEITVFVQVSAAVIFIIQLALPYGQPLVVPDLSIAFFKEIQRFVFTATGSPFSMRLTVSIISRVGPPPPSP